MRIAQPDAPDAVVTALADEVAGLCSSLRRGSAEVLRTLRKMAETHPDRLRVSRHLDGWLDVRRVETRRVRDRRAFEADLSAGRRSLDDLLRIPLLPY